MYISSQYAKYHVHSLRDLEVFTIFYNTFLQVHLLRLLLDHDPSRRPTATEILQSEFLPPPQMEEAELNEVLRSTIANPDSKLYKRMIDAIFSQPVTPAMDFAYDNELYKVGIIIFG